MTKIKVVKWAQIPTLMAAIAASLVSEVASAKSYADGLVKKNKTPHIVGSSLVFPADAEAKIVGSTLVLSK